jgi:hypothetical protein
MLRKVDDTTTVQRSRYQGMHLNESMYPFKVKMFYRLLIKLYHWIRQKEAKKNRLSQLYIYINVAEWRQIDGGPSINISMSNANYFLSAKSLRLPVILLIQNCIQLLHKLCRHKRRKAHFCQVSFKWSLSLHFYSTRKDLWKSLFAFAAGTLLKQTFGHFRENFLLPGIRVTRLGEFSPNERLFTVGSFFL